MSRERKKRPAPKDRQAIADVAGQLAELEGMEVRHLEAKYRELFGVPTRSRNKDYLRKKLRWRIQELAEGGLSERAKDKIQELGADAPVRWRASSGDRPAVVAAPATKKPPRDPRLPEPGAVLTREYKGVEHRVAVLEEGLEYEGERYRSLSRIAHKITGTSWNGWTFFGLQSRLRKSAKEATQ